MAPGPDLVVLSHLRWDFVWQRPQHLVSRMARRRQADGGRTWFVEEPRRAAVPAPRLHQEPDGPVTRVWLQVPDDGDDVHLTFGCPGTEAYGDMLADLLDGERRPPAPDIWIYTPMALDVASAVDRGRLVYDVMDDLSSFHIAPPALAMRQRRLLAEADVVFTGGRSLHDQVSQQRPHSCHLFPSGVEPQHYARSRTLRRPHTTPVAGFVGVVDERMDLDLVAGLAERLADWRIEIVGPVLKISPDTLPEAPNLNWWGPREYADLPEVMAGFDVALMPFARNKATRSISPTKTLEYLAAGLPVVSTRVPDVVADYGSVVHFADDAAGFAAACRQVLGQSSRDRDRRLSAIRTARDWDTIAEAMHAILSACSAAADAQLEGEATA